MSSQSRDKKIKIERFFLETPLRMDDIKEISKLHDALKASGTATKIAYGEWQVGLEQTCYVF